MVQWSDWGVTTVHIGLVYIMEPDSMDVSKIGYRWGVPKQLNCQKCGIGVWVENMVRISQNLKRDGFNKNSFFSWDTVKTQCVTFIETLM
jgi:hypothetical protein